MNEYFADSSYYIGLLVSTDEAHEPATRLTPELDGPIITTSFVLLELSAYFARPPQRAVWSAFVQQMRADAHVTVLPASEEWVERGWAIYQAHVDKSWSLTDCISFAVMRERDITDALTTDHHFLQAGFRRLLAQS